MAQNEDESESEDEDEKPQSKEYVKKPKEVKNKHNPKKKPESK